MNINTVSQPGLVQSGSPLPRPAPAGHTAGAPHPFTTLLQAAHGPLTHTVPNAMRTQASSLNAHAVANRMP
jgi:hypothetical protein